MSHAAYYREAIGSFFGHLDQGSSEWGVGAKSEIFKDSGGSVFGSVFYITYVFLYFDAYMSTKACKMLN